MDLQHYAPEQLRGTVSFVPACTEWRIYWNLSGHENAMYRPASDAVPRDMLAKRERLLRHGATCSQPRLYSKSAAWLARVRESRYRFTRRFDTDKWGAVAKQQAEKAHREYCISNRLFRHNHREEAAGELANALLQRAHVRSPFGNRVRQIRIEDR